MTFFMTEFIQTLCVLKSINNHENILQSMQNNLVTLKDYIFISYHVTLYTKSSLKKAYRYNLHYRLNVLIRQF